MMVERRRSRRLDATLRTGVFYVEHKFWEDRTPVVPLFEPWKADAACAGSDPDLFYNELDQDDAKRVCKGCPVADDCLQSALSNRELHGIWGGLTTRERDRVRRHRTVACPQCLRLFKPGGDQRKYCCTGCATEARSVAQRKWARRHPRQTV